MATISIDSTNVTASTIIPDTNNSRKNEVFTAPQGIDVYDLNGKTSAFPYIFANNALAFFFANYSNSDIEISFLPFARVNNTWQYAYVPAGTSLPIIMRAVKPYTAANFLTGHKICL